MITPPFQVTQDDEFIYVHMKIKYIKASECDFYIDGNLFKFHCRPYFLRLTFPQPLVDDGREQAAYDLEKGEMQVKVAKKNKGEIFENLDMLSLLLGVPTEVVTYDKSEMVDLMHVKAGQEEESAFDEENEIYSKLVLVPSRARPKGYKPSIEVVGESSMDNAMVTDDIASPELDAENEIDPTHVAPVLDPEFRYDTTCKMVEDDDPYDWSHPQTVPAPFSENKTNSVKYGFKDLYEGYFDVDRLDAVDIEDPDAIPVDSRRKLRLLSENSAFDFDHYIADFMDPSTIESLKQYQPQWIQEYDILLRLDLDPSLRPIELESGISTTNQTRNDEIAVPWTDNHRDVLVKLPKREYSDFEDHETMLGLVDIIFAYAYNLRTMEGENTVESAWTIVKLSSVLSWFDKMTTLQEVLISSARRALIFPLYRNWSLVQTIFQDVYQIFYLGKRAILRALIEIKQLCDISESKHILSRLYLDDYCNWIQRVPRKRFSNLASQIVEMTEKISKSDLGLPLTELESLALEDAHHTDPSESSSKMLIEPL
jgi:protein SHQ1